MKNVIDQRRELEDTKALLNLDLIQDILKARAHRHCFITFCQVICTHWAFSLFINICIILNTIVFSLQTYPENDTLNNLNEEGNFIFFCIFVLEMVVKLFGLGLFVYFQDKFNIFDFVVVTLSIVDEVSSNTTILPTGGGVISALRAFRLLRIFKLAKSWKKF